MFGNWRFALYFWNLELREPWDSVKARRVKTTALAVAVWKCCFCVYCAGAGLSLTLTTTTCINITSLGEGWLDWMTVTRTLPVVVMEHNPIWCLSTWPLCSVVIFASSIEPTCCDVWSGFLFPDWNRQIEIHAWGLEVGEKYVGTLLKSDYHLMIG